MEANSGNERTGAAVIHAPAGEAPWLSLRNGLVTIRARSTVEFVVAAPRVERLQLALPPPRRLPDTHRLDRIAAHLRCRRARSCRRVWFEFGGGGRWLRFSSFSSPACSCVRRYPYSLVFSNESDHEKMVSEKAKNIRIIERNYRPVARSSSSALKVVASLVCHTHMHQTRSSGSHIFMEKREYYKYYHCTVLQVLVVELL